VLVRRAAVAIFFVSVTLQGCVTAPDLPNVSCGSCYRGYPIGSVDLVLENEAYTAGYSEIRMDPLWVCYRVFAVADPVSHSRPSRFSTDYRTDAQVSHDDYTNSGYDRGHMAPNAAIDYCYGQDAQRETFLMSNICPQTPTLNRGVWASLEEDVRNWADAYEEVWVCTGPIFDDTHELLASGVEIPDRFYKIVVDDTGSGLRALAFLIPQVVVAGSVSESFLTSIDEIESASGLDFLADLDDSTEDSLESQTSLGLW